MKAVVVENYSSIDEVELKQAPMPALAPGSLRVRVRTVGIGFVDGLKVQGLYQTKDPLPFIPGTEFAGEVEAVGDGVTGYTPGIQVMGMVRSGALAEYVTVAAEAVRILPDGISAAAGASFRANYLTAHYALTERASYKLANRCSSRAQPEASEPPRYIWGRYSVGASLRPPRPKRNENFALDRLHAIEFRKRLS